MAHTKEDAQREKGKLKIYRFLASTLETSDQVYPYLKEKKIPNELISKISIIYAPDDVEAYSSFKNTDTYIDFEEQNNNKKIFIFRMEPDCKIFREFGYSGEIEKYYKNCSSRQLQKIYDTYQVKNREASSIFYDFILQENNYYERTDSDIECFLLKNCSNATQDKCLKILEKDVTLPDVQLEFAQELLNASNEVHKKTNPNSPICQWMVEVYRSPALHWASFAVRQDYLPAFSFESMILHHGAKDVEPHKELSLALILHAAFSGDEPSQLKLAREHHKESKVFNMKNLVDYNLEFSDFWYKVIAIKDNPATYEELAKYYDEVKNNHKTANEYYLKLIEAGRKVYYYEYIENLIKLQNYEKCQSVIYEIMDSTDKWRMKRVFQIVRDKNCFDKFSDSQLKLKICKEIVELDYNTEYHAYLAETYYEMNNMADFRKHIHVLLSLDDANMVSESFNILKCSVFPRLNDVTMEIEFLQRAYELGNAKANTFLNDNYKKTFFGNWKRRKGWAEPNRRV